MFGYKSDPPERDPGIYPKSILWPIFTHEKSANP